MSGRPAVGADPVDRQALRPDLDLRMANASIPCMATRGPARRHGAATAVLHRLAHEARAAGVANLYLAVMAENTAARALYGRAGFTATHEYCSYGRPLADGGTEP